MPLVQCQRSASIKWQSFTVIFHSPDPLYCGFRADWGVKAWKPRNHRSLTTYEGTQMITIDSRPAGAGKTTGHIYPKIQRLVDFGDHVLLVVPSIALQEQYQKHFSGMSEFVKLNHEDTLNVSDRLLSFVTQKLFKIVCVTHQAWLKTALPREASKDWHLIIDEAITPYRTFGYDNSNLKTANVKIDWSALVTLGTSNNTYLPAEFSIQNDSWTRQITSLQDLSHTNWNTFCQQSAYNTLCNKETGEGLFLQELKPSMVTNYLTCHIASAAFEKTFMYFWLSKNRISTKIIPGGEFEIRELPVRVHSPNGGYDGFNWSISKQKKFPYLINQYQKYVNEVMAVSNHSYPLLAVRNNSSSNSFDAEEKLNHNPHGINHYTNYSAISLESALNPRNEVAKWFRSEWGMSNEQIKEAYSCYLFYQIIMRTCLRTAGNQKMVDVFLLDTKTVIGLRSFFSWDPDKGVVLFDLVVPTPTHKPKKKAMTAAERMRKSREKKRLAQESIN